ncbi:MAG: isovaleryl-CoA dehydrogenase [Cyclobacteriaceae bacterium]|nr:MAG: isovaleryl-CoA dehydrogenase [Cyclobacteriaceae bacterium]
MQPWHDPDLEEIRENYLQFAEKLNGDTPKRDLEGEFSPERWKRVADSGFLRLLMPNSLGGNEVPVTHLVAAMEGLGEGCRDGGFNYALCNQICGIQNTINMFGSDQLKAEYLPDLMSGKSMAAYGFTENTSGSDAYSMETNAIADGDDFILNGTKQYITNAPYANLAIVFAKTTKTRSPFSLTAFLVDMDWDGASHGQEFDKMGLRTVRMGELIFDNVRVPKSNILGVKGGGLRVLTESTLWERAILTATALGPMARGLKSCIERAKSRTQFDKPIGSFQQISSKIANMIQRYKLSRLVIYDMASRLGNGTSLQPHAQDAAIAKIFVTDNFIKFELDAMQIFGVRGYLLESFHQQDLRDSLSFSIWAGTSETLRNTVAKLAGLPVE